MKKTAFILAFALLLTMFGGCATEKAADIAATALPVYQFTSILCEGTGLTVTRLVTESVSCLHDYPLEADQPKAIEGAKLIVLSGAGLEDFMEKSLSGKKTIDASLGVKLLESCHEEDHAGHNHQKDPHIWLSVNNAKIMAKNIYQGLCDHFPAYKDIFHKNMGTLMNQLDKLQAYGKDQLANLQCRKMVTFHDGFAYLAQSYGLTILAAVEEESGSEAASRELIELVRQHDLPGIFMEANGSDAAAKTIATEAGVNLYILNMAMSGDDYFAAMYHNIDTIRDALQ